MPFSFSGEVPTFGGDNANAFKFFAQPATTQPTAYAQPPFGTTPSSGAIPFFGAAPLSASNTQSSFGATPSFGSNPSFDSSPSFGRSASPWSSFASTSTAPAPKHTPTLTDEKSHSPAPPSTTSEKPTKNFWEEDPFPDALERALENRPAKFGPEAIKADNTLHSALVKLGKKSGAAARNELASLRDELKAAEQHSPKVLELLKLLFTEANRVTTSISLVSYDGSPPPPQQASKLSYQALKTLVFRVRGMFVAAGYTVESAENHIREMSDVLQSYYTLEAIEEFLDNQTAMGLFENGLPIPKFHEWLFAQRKSVLRVSQVAGGSAATQRSDRLFKHARDSDIHKDLMHDIEAEISKDDVWPANRIELFRIMVSNALLEGADRETLREKVYIFEEPFEGFVEWLEDQIAWLEDAPNRKAKRDASWFLPLPQQRLENREAKPPKVPIVEYSKSWICNARACVPFRSHEQEAISVPDKPFRFMDLPPEIRVCVYRHLLVPTGEISLRTCIHHWPILATPLLTPGILATCKLVNKETRDLVLENNFIVTAAIEQSTRPSIHRKQMPPHLISQIKTLTIVVDAAAKLQAFADIRSLQAATKLEKLRICAVSYGSNVDMSQLDRWKLPLADIVYRVPKACKVACGAVTELEREHTQDRVSIMGAYLGDPVHKSGSGELMAVGKEMLERFVAAVRDGQGSLVGKPVDAVELRFNPLQRV